MSRPSVVIRGAVEADLDVVGQMAGQLVRAHHAWDAKRFMLPDDVESGYVWWFGKELMNTKACILVAERGNGLLGYAYARMEGKDWNALRDACAALHDIYVEPSVRREGVAKLLLDSVFEWSRKKRAPRIILHSASTNVNAHKLFHAMGFRTTMLEMTRELDDDG